MAGCARGIIIMNQAAKTYLRDKTDNFAVNLRHLCSFYRSISDVSRKLGINRSQFNKYLNGTSRPSMHIMQRIVHFFGVEEYELAMPSHQFSQLVELRPKHSGVPNRPGFESHIYELQRIGKIGISSYEGVYYEYYFSMSYPGYILRSLLILNCEDSGAYYMRIERLSPKHRAERKFRCIYKGIALYLADRIYFLDYESLTRSEISQTIYFPNYKSRKTFLSGLKMGVSANNTHTPTSTRAVLEYLGKDVNLKQALSKCGLHSSSSSSIREEIKLQITNKIDESEYHLTPKMLS